MAPASAAASDLLARNVLTQRLHVRPKETVLIESWPTSLPWASAFVRQSRRIGAKPVVLYEDEASYWQAVASGGAKALGQLGDHEWAALEKTDVYVYFWGPENRGRTRALPEKTQEELTGFNGRWYELAAKTGLRGARMEIARATETNARYYGVNLGTWRRELFQASVRDPREFDRPIRKLRQALASGTTLRIRHPNGTDLSLGLAGREPLALDGRVTPQSMQRPYGMLVNVPAAVVLVAIDESVADGTIRANGPNYLPNGPVSGGQWKFSGGHLRGARYATGGARFRGPYAMGGEGRDLPGLLEIGLDPAIHVAPELEDCELGALTLGIGGNAGFGGRTKSSFNSWLTVRGAELSVDGRVVVRGGRIRS